MNLFQAITSAMDICLAKDPTAGVLTQCCTNVVALKSVVLMLLF